MEYLLNIVTPLIVIPLPTRHKANDRSTTMAAAKSCAIVARSRATPRETENALMASSTAAWRVVSVHVTEVAPPQPPRAREIVRLPDKPEQRGRSPGSFRPWAQFPDAVDLFQVGARNARKAWTECAQAHLGLPPDPPGR